MLDRAQQIARRLTFPIFRGYVTSSSRVGQMVVDVEISLPMVAEQHSFVLK